MIRSSLACVAVLGLASHAFADADVDALERGVALFKSGDFAAAIEPLTRAHASDPADPDTALLLGIAYFRVHQIAKAVPLLEQAERDSDADGKASAQIFLGLIADQRGQTDRAQRYYALVSHSPGELGPSGRLLLERSGPERWSIVAILRPGFDSNVPLLTTTARGPGNARADADATLIAAATARPSEDVPLVLDETISYRALAQLTEYNMLGDVLGATLTFADRCNHASLAYHFEASTLGGARYELGHVVDGVYRRSLHDGFGIGAHYTFAARDFAQDAYAGYTGLWHTAVAEAAWGGPASAHEVALGYVFLREGTDDPSLSVIGHGGRIVARIRAWRGGEIRGSVLVADRLYTAGRADLQTRSDAALYIDLSAALGVVLGTTLVTNASNTADESYTKLTVFAGLVIGASS